MITLADFTDAINYRCDEAEKATGEDRQTELTKADGIAQFATFLAHRGKLSVNNTRAVDEFQEAESRLMRLQMNRSRA